MNTDWHRRAAKANLNQERSEIFLARRRAEAVLSQFHCTHDKEIDRVAARTAHDKEIDLDRVAARTTHDKEIEADQVAHAAELSQAAARSADDDKVTQHHEQLAEQLQQAITEHGEGGWVSPFCTTGLPAGLTSRQVTTYRKWLQARNNWTRTGDLAYKQALVDLVDFDCPPAPVATEPKVSQQKIIPANAGFLLVYAITVTIIALYLMIFL